MSVEVMFIGGLLCRAMVGVNTRSIAFRQNSSPYADYNPNSPCTWRRQRGRASSNSAGCRQTTHRGAADQQRLADVGHHGPHAGSRCIPRPLCSSSGGDHPTSGESMCRALHTPMPMRHWLSC
jgi:hypothetical protein